MLSAIISIENLIRMPIMGSLHWGKQVVDLTKKL